MHYCIKWTWGNLGLCESAWGALNAVSCRNLTKTEMQRAGLFRAMAFRLCFLFSFAFIGDAAAQDAVKVARADEPAKRRLKSVEAAAAGSPALAKPEVLMSAGHKATCRKWVGDRIGEINVTDIKDSDHQLPKLLSDKLTVLIFWRDNSRAGMEQFRRIPVDILGSYAKHRVKVIAANVGGDATNTRRLTGKYDEMIVSLVDANEELFSQFATSGAPRTYLLDSDGKILWFDIEYSQSTQRELENALNYFLSK